jgi:hypothetical protein
MFIFALITLFIFFLSWVTRRSPKKSISIDMSFDSKLLNIHDHEDDDNIINNSSTTETVYLGTEPMSRLLESLLHV